MQYDLMGLVPGISAIRETVEKEVFWGPWEYNRAFIVPTWLDGAARDAGGSPTTLLRPGLLLGMNSSTYKWSEWDATATDGTEKIAGVLLYAEYMQSQGSNQDKWYGYIAVGGNVKASSILVPGNASYGLAGDANEYYVRSLMAPRFRFDDMHHEHSFDNTFSKVIEKSASYTVTADDNNALIVQDGSAGAVTFTLPAITASKGMRFRFYNTDNQNMVIASAAAGDLIALGNAAANTVTFSTTSQKVGACAEVIGLDNASWLVTVLQGTGTVA